MKLKPRNLFCLLALAALWGIGMRRDDARREACDAHILQRQRELASLRQTIPGELELAGQADRVQRDTAFLDALLPPQGAMDQTFKDICQLAAANSLQIAVIKRSGDREIGRYIDSPIELAVNGDFNGFYSFLLQVEALPRLKRIAHLQIQNIPRQGGDVRASITLDVFSELTAPTAAAAVSHDPRIGEQFAQAFSPPGLRQIPLGQLKSNPFGSGSSQAQQARPSAAVQAQAVEERAAALKGVAALQLESVALGAGHDSCVINGTTYHEGQQIDGFTIEMISPRSVTVGSGIYQFELAPSQ